MAKRKSPRPASRTVPGRKTADRGASGGLTEDERAAMRDRLRELKAERKPTQPGEANDETAVLAKIASMSVADRTIAERVHAIIKATAPDLSAKLWYGMPAYARNGQVVCFVQPAGRFKARYATLGFSDKAALDEGSMWPVAYAVTKLNAASEAAIAELLTKAAR